MRQVRYHEYGGPEVLRIEEVAKPEPAPGQVLIEIEAVGANMIDAVLRAGTGLWRWPLPATLTGDVVGRVTGVGTDVTTASVGDRVATLSDRAVADYVTAEADWLARVPDEADAAEATVLAMMAPLARGLLRSARLTGGETVLVQSAAGGVGHLIVQLAQILGAGRVIGTASTEAKRAFIHSLGATAVDSADPGWAERVREVAPDGVDIVLDAVGGEVFEAGIDLLAPLGRMVTYGAIGGGTPTVNALNLYGLKQVTGFSIQTWRAERPEQARADMDEVAGLLGAGRLRSAVHARLPLAEVAAAHAILDDRANSGRVVLLP